jgi:formylmethanofuran dehydrogenase subunit D
METDQRLRVKLMTGRTIEQGVGKEQGKASKEYFESVATCLIDPADMKKLRIDENDKVLVSTKHGSVVVEARKSLSGPHAGIIFIPYGPWANVVVETETDSTGMPSFKGTPATVEPAPGKQVSGLEELLRKQFGK